MKYLDLGCGNNAQNPYGAIDVYGVDISLGNRTVDNQFRICNLACDPIPFDDCFFDSVSAFDVLEHIPRQMINYATKTVKNPFVDLMSDIHRVLKPGGLFYAVTTAYPALHAFDDPTHVNFITERTHAYFCSPNAQGKMYGLKGEFELVESRWLYPKYARTSSRSHLNLLKNLLIKIRGKGTHVVWQLKAVK